MSNIVKVENGISVDDSVIKIGEVYSYNDYVVEVTGFEETENGYHRVLTKGYGWGSSCELNEFRKLFKKMEGVTLKELNSISKKVMSGDLNINDLMPKDDTGETGLMVVNTDMYLAMREKVQIAEAKVKAIYAIVTKKTDALRSQVRGVISEMNKIVKRLNNVIFTLELYAGISESIKQIQSGQSAGEDEPICLNQQMRFMDEEVGDPANGGVSYDSIEKFDTWLLSRNTGLNCFNYEILLPQPKSVRIMRVRATASDRYTRDAWNNIWQIREELKTYVLIRNGENIYTISSLMDFSTQLFPNEEELMNIVQNQDNEKMYDKLEKYKHGMILMQGLIDRTDIFGHLYGKVSFLSTKSQEEGRVFFQYEIDDDHLLTDGSKTFLDFLNTTEIKAGDRILIVNPTMYYKSSDYGRLFKRYYASKYSVPDRPDDGIYELFWDKGAHTLYFKYLPEKDVYSSWGYDVSKRKNRESYLISQRDENIVNIDAVSHRDIDWIEQMFYDRRDRKKYLKVQVLLKALQKYKREELELERPFVLMIVSAIGCTELEALDAVHWWKTKNKYKRALSADDQKAFRMISKKIKSDKLNNHAN